MRLAVKQHLKHRRGSFVFSVRFDYLSFPFWFYTFVECKHLLIVNTMFQKISFRQLTVWVATQDTALNSPANGNCIWGCLCLRFQSVQTKSTGNQLFAAEYSCLSMWKGVPLIPCVSWQHREVSFHLAATPPTEIHSQMSHLLGRVKAHSTESRWLETGKKALRRKGCVVPL